MESPVYKWMITRATPIDGNPLLMTGGANGIVLPRLKNTSRLKLVSKFDGWKAPKIREITSWFLLFKGSSPQNGNSSLDKVSPGAWGFPLDFGKFCDGDRPQSEGNQKSGIWADGICIKVAPLVHCPKAAMAIKLPHLQPPNRICSFGTWNLICSFQRASFLPIWVSVTSSQYPFILTKLAKQPVVLDVHGHDHHGSHWKFWCFHSYWLILTYFLTSRASATDWDFSGH